MGGRPALVRQRDLKQIINAARKAGASGVEIQMGAVPIIIRLDATDTDTTLPEDSNNSFDKIMRK
jgi:hypothetical protein